MLQTTIKSSIEPSTNTTNFTQISTSSISQPVSSNHHDDEDTSTSPTTAALIISSTSLLGLIIVIVIYGLCKYKGNKKKVAASSYENLDQSDQTSGSIPSEPTADVWKYKLLFPQFVCITLWCILNVVRLCIKLKSTVYW